MLQRIRHILVKELLQVFRDPKLRPILFLMPVVQVLLYGYAATNDVRHARLAVMDLDNTPLSRELVARFEKSTYFRLVRRLDREDQVPAVIDRGQALAVLRTNAGFAGDVQGGRTGQVQLILDGAESNTAGIVLGYAARIVARFSEELADGQLRRLHGRLPPPVQVRLEPRVWFNENLDSRNFFVPGVIAMLVMISTLTLTSMAVVREKEIGTIEQILVTPIRPAEFIIGKSTPFVLISLFHVVLITTVAVFWFEVPLRGSLLILFAGTLLFLMTSIGVGLLISTVSHTQQQAMMSTSFFTFPAILLSGYFFPIANMPEPVQWLTYANPLRYFLVVIRAVFLKGVGLDILWPQMVGLAVIGVLTLWLASRRFHKTLA